MSDRGGVPAHRPRVGDRPRRRLPLMRAVQATRFGGPDGLLTWRGQTRSRVRRRSSSRCPSRRCCSSTPRSAVASPENGSRSSRRTCRAPGWPDGWSPSGRGWIPVQLAHAAGARVIAAAGSEPKLDRARERGATAVVDDTRAAWSERVRDATGGPGPQLVLDGAGGEIGRAAFELTAPEDGSRRTARRAGASPRSSRGRPSGGA
jgi:hypothetical protein